MKTKRRVDWLALALAIPTFCGGSIVVAGDDDNRTPPSVSPFFINLADDAKGDGTNETDAMQRAVDDLPRAGGKAVAGDLSKVTRASCP